MGFGIGERIEVCSKEEGFKGSFFAATVIAKPDKNSYYVRYKNLLENDGLTRLVEKVTKDEVRPVPQKINASSTLSRYSMFDEVDAFDQDGWWVGKIIEKVDEEDIEEEEDQEPMYYVYFSTYAQKIAYPISRLRAHLEWINGKWVSSKKFGY